MIYIYIFTLDKDKGKFWYKTDEPVIPPGIQYCCEYILGSYTALNMHLMNFVERGYNDIRNAIDRERLT